MALGIFFRSLYAHFIVWSGIRNLYFEDIRVFQACACGDYAWNNKVGLVACFVGFYAIGSD